jgi:hypothetical protein
MKRIAIIFSLLGFGGLVYGSTITQPAAPPISVLTLTQVAASTPTYVGQVVVCSNCASANNAKGVLCISTQAVSQNGYIIAGSSNTGATNTTCK